MPTAALSALLSLEFPVGERDALNATAQHRVLAECLRVAATGQFWAAPRPSWEMTFTQGPVGWVCHAVPFVVHDNPELLALGGGAFTDGANLWIHGPWLQRQAAHVANDAQALVDWAHLAMGELAEWAQGQAPADPLVPTVNPARVAQILAPLDATQQAPLNRWHAPGDTRAIHQALQWAERFDLGFAASGLPTSNRPSGLPAMPAPTPWKAWATLVAAHLPDNDGLPVLSQNQTPPEAMERAQRLLSHRWHQKDTDGPLAERLAQALKKEGLLDGPTFCLMANTLQAVALGSLSCTATGFEDIPTATSLNFTANSLKDLGLQGVDQNMANRWIMVHPFKHRPEASSVPPVRWRQACIWAALEAGVGLESIPAQGTPTCSPWVFELDAWKTLERGGSGSSAQHAQDQVAAGFLLESLAQAGFPLTYRPELTEVGISLAPRTPEETLTHSASKGQFFRSLMRAPLFAATSQQTPDSLLTGLAAEGLCYLERPDAEDAYHFLQTQLEVRQWNHTDGLEQLGHALLKGYMEGRYGMTLDKLWVTKQRFEQALGLTAEHWLPALLSHSNRLSAWNMMGMLEGEIHAFLRNGSDLHRVRSSLGRSIQEWALTHPDAPSMGSLTNLIRHHGLEQTLPEPKAKTPRQRARF